MKDFVKDIDHQGKKKIMELIKSGIAWLPLKNLVADD
jgi:hypothetical protein